VLFLLFARRRHTQLETTMHEPGQLANSSTVSLCALVVRMHDYMFPNSDPMITHRTRICRSILVARLSLS